MVPDLNTPFQTLAIACQHLHQWPEVDLRAPFWRLYLNLDSGAEIVTSRWRLPLEAGRLYLLPQETSFRPRLHRPVRHLYLHFFLRMECVRREPPYYALDLDSAGQAAGEALSEHLLTGKSPEAPRARILSGFLISWALSQVPTGEWVQPGDHPRFHALLRELETRQFPAWTNTRLAQEAAMSTNAFIRLFRQQEGVSPQAWLRARRVDLACHYLLHTHRSIDQIAEQLGFSSRFHFSAVFKKARGVSPARYRRAS